MQLYLLARRYSHELAFGVFICSADKEWEWTVQNRQLGGAGARSSTELTEYITVFYN